MSHSASGDAPERVRDQEGATPLTEPATTTTPPESPAGDGPAGNGPAGDRPAGNGPAGDRPTGERPVGDGAPSEPPAPRRGKVPRTKTSLAWNALIAGVIVLILLLVFILENTQSVKISYFGASFNMPLGVALLLAAIGGALLVAIVGTARIVQLRRRVRRAP